MAELSAAASAGVVASERDALLATKPYVPGPRPGFVARPRLARALGEGLARGLVLVCAPAGFGKTLSHRHVHHIDVTASCWALSPLARAKLAVVALSRLSQLAAD